MGDRQLAGGIDVIGTFEPIQVWAGENGPNGLTDRGTVASGQKIGKLNARNETYKFGLLAEVAGKLVAWDPTLNGEPGDDATGTVTFSTAVPTAGNTVTLNGHAMTFAAERDDDAMEVAIGATLAETAANLADFINDHRNEFGVDLGVSATSSAGVTTIASPGLAGNSVTLAKVGTNIAVSGANLSGGDNDTGVVGGAAKIIGVLPHAIDTSATGHNADTDVSYWIGGIFNFDAMDVPEGTTLLEVKRAAYGSQVGFQKLY